jgi:hypothetical protein
MNYSGLNLTFSIEKSSIQYCPTSRGVAYHAKLLLDGKPVGTIENSGRGGFTQNSLNNPKTVGPLLKDAADRADTTVEFYLEDLMDVVEGVA